MVHGVPEGCLTSEHVIRIYCIPDHVFAFDNSYSMTLQGSYRCGTVVMHVLLLNILCGVYELDRSRMAALHQIITQAPLSTIGTAYCAAGPSTKFITF
jgi:hypothetical protein